MCAIKHRWDPKSDKTPTDQVIPIVVGSSEKPFAWDVKRLPAEDPEKKNAKKEGLRVTLSGSSYQQRGQRAVIDFRCDPGLVGTEEEWESIDEYKKEEKEKKRRDDEGDGGDDGDGGEDDASTPEEQLKKEGAALIWEGYRHDRDEDGKDMDSLYLTWYTKHACDAAVDEPAAESGHWGFFTWLVIL